MPEEMKIGCARLTGPDPGDPVKPSASADQVEKTANTKEVKMIKVGQKAHDFTAPAYHNGKFVNVKLSEYLGKWVVLCFYPGDFTFV